MNEIYVFGPDFDGENVEFTSMGLVGALEPTECIFHEVVNGESQVTLKHPIDALEKYKALQRSNILLIPVPTRSCPEVDSETKKTSIWSYTVKNPKLLTSKAQRTLYKSYTKGKNDSEKKPSGPIKVLPKDTEVTVVKKPSDDNSYWKVKCKYGTGWINPICLELQIAMENVDESYAKFEMSKWTTVTQPFRIYEVTEKLDGIEVVARHISYDLMYNLTTYKNEGRVKLSDALNGILNNCYADHEFTALTNIKNVRAGLQYEGVNPINAFLDPESGICELYDVNLIRDWTELNFLDDPGIDHNIRLEYGRNLTGVELKVSEDNVATRIVPVGEKKNGDPLYLSNDIDKRYIDSDYIDAFGIPHVYELKCENCKVGDKEEGDKEVTEAIAKARMRDQANAFLESGCDIPKIEMSVEFVDLGTTAEYAHYKELESVYLFDYVTVSHPKYVYKTQDGEIVPLIMTARVVEVEWDVLKDRMKSVKIGDVTESLASMGVPTWAVPSGISGLKIKGGTIEGKALKADSIEAKHIKSDTIETRHLKANSIDADKIQADAITANKIAANQITAVHIAADQIKARHVSAEDITAIAAKINWAQIDTLTARIADIAIANINTANIISANINWAQIEKLNAHVADIVLANINTANIETANINWANITSLRAAAAGIVDASIQNLSVDDASIAHLRAKVADIVNASISTAEIAWADIIGAHIEDASIDWANITTLNTAVATILDANIKSLTADHAWINSLTANEGFINSLHVDVENVNNLSAKVATISDGKINNANIDVANIGNLKTDIADIITVKADRTTMNFADVGQLVSQAMILEEGVGGQVAIKNLVATNASFVGATIGDLVVGGDDGKYYRISVQNDGTIYTAEVPVTPEEATAGETHDGFPIVATTANVASLYAGDLKSNEAIIAKIFTSALDAGKIKASEAFISSATIPRLYTTAIQAMGDELVIAAADLIEFVVGQDVAAMHSGARNYIPHSRVPIDDIKLTVKRRTKILVLGSYSVLGFSKWRRCGAFRTSQKVPIMWAGRCGDMRCGAGYGG